MKQMNRSADKIQGQSFFNTSKKLGACKIEVLVKKLTQPFQVKLRLIPAHVQKAVWEINLSQRNGPLKKIEKVY